MNYELFICAYFLQQLKKNKERIRKKEKEEEIDHIKAALAMNDYPTWMLVKENGEGKKN